MVFRYRNFSVYKDAQEFHKEILQFTRKFPYYLQDQICRASLSIILNIAEGSGKSTDKDLGNFLQISLGSVSEVMACLEVAALNNLIDQPTFNKLSQDCEKLSKQLGGFRKHLKTTS